jgi:hypothetical protein
MKIKKTLTIKETIGDIPSVNGDAKGFEKTVCRNNPTSDKPAPAPIARRIDKARSSIIDPKVLVSFW